MVASLRRWTVPMQVSLVRSKVKHGIYLPTRYQFILLGVRSRKFGVNYYTVFPPWKASRYHLWYGTMEMPGHSTMHH